MLLRTLFAQASWPPAAPGTTQRCEWGGVKSAERSSAHTLTQQHSELHQKCLADPAPGSKQAAEQSYLRVFSHANCRASVCTVCRIRAFKNTA